jgi:hypothetical protein
MKVGRRWRIRPEDVAAMLERAEQDTRAELEATRPRTLTEGLAKFDIVPVPDEATTDEYGEGARPARRRSRSTAQEPKSVGVG